MLVFAVLSLLVVFYGVAQWRFYQRRRRLSRTSVLDLVARIQPVNVDAVSEIARSFLNPSKTQLEMEPPVMWMKIGEVEGLNALVANADAILDLASIAAQWNQVEGRIVAEMVRRDGIRLKRAARKIQLAVHFGIGGTFAPFQLQEFVTAYYLMRGRVLGLYDSSHSGIYPRLIAVL